MANDIHPTAVIGSGVVLGESNYVGPYAVIDGDTVIGDDNWIGPHVAVGTPGQWTQDKGRSAVESRLARGVRLGSHNVVREFVTVHQGNDRATQVGSNCYLMAGVHIPHDAWVDDEVTITNNTLLAGHSRVHWRANIGLGSVVHQKSTIGPLAMIGMQAAVVRDVPPFALVAGVPARIKGANVVGMTRAGVSETMAKELDEAYRAGDTADDLVEEILERLGRSDWAATAPTQPAD